MPIALPILENIRNLDSTIFPFVANVAPFPAWLLLILAPRWRTSRRVAFFTLASLGVLYGLLLVSPMRRHGFVPAMKKMTTYDGVRELLAERDTALLSWVHFIVADLGTGLWIVHDSLARDIHRLIMVPQVLLSMLFAPLGCVLYVCVTRPLFSRLPNPNHGLPRHKRD
jgi:hypothetical protein